jgi:lysophospholipase L1-like esterase
LACALPWQAHALAAEAAQKPTLLVLGDSLSAEYGLARGSGWVALLVNAWPRRHAPGRWSTAASAATPRPVAAAACPPC